MSSDPIGRTRARPKNAAPILITWAATSLVKSDQMPIGKTWTPSGKWPVTAAVQRSGKSNTYAFEQVAYRGLEEAAADILRRIKGGSWTIIAGAPRPELDLKLLHRRLGANFVDAPTSLFIIDADGLTPDPGRDLSRPEHFGKAIVDAVRARLTKAGVNTLAKAKLILLATASTGYSVNSAGEPARGCARFRLLFEVDKALTLAQQRVIMEAISKLPGFQSIDATKDSCIDVNITTLSGNIFVARPQGIGDSIATPVLIFDGEPLVDAETLGAELDLGGIPAVEPDTPRKPAGDRVMKAPEEKREALLSALVRALPNECAPRGDLAKWAGVGHAVYGACDGADWGFDVFSEWCSRWKSGDHVLDEPRDNERLWPTLHSGRNGISYLLGWAHSTGNADAIEAARAIELSIFTVIEGGPVRRRQRTGKHQRQAEGKATVSDTGGIHRRI
jgi:hypothetical protein